VDTFEFDIDLSGSRYCCRATCRKAGLDFRYIVEFPGPNAPGNGHPIIVLPAHEHPQNWYFLCEDGKNALEYYSLTLLELVGEEIDKFNLRSIL
jgi:hypothetical protein